MLVSLLSGRSLRNWQRLSSQNAIKLWSKFDYLIPGYRSVWTAGDEVSFGFSVAAGLSDFPFILLYWPILALSMLLIAVCVVSGWLPAIDLVDFEQQSWLSSVYAWIDTYFVDPVLSSFLYFLALLVILGTVAIAVTWLLCVNLYGLGLRNVLSPLWVRFFATPVPIGPRFSEFRSIDPGTSALSHSAVYGSDRLVEIVADWITERASA
jgi:hypothetical protein